ncbi:hypothetical protein [Streptomyces parvulus]|uniref:hypothetical protein n=1 Tax=Streptomyces parvulus TaxID=146923 RepID=UPI00370298DF
MAQNSWPSPDYNARAVTDSEYEMLAARFSDDGVDGRPSDPAIVTAGAGLSVNVRADAHGSIRGRAWSSGSTPVNLAIGANASGSTRTDRVVLRLDRATWTIRAVVKAGTPGSGPPALTQTLGDTGLYEVPLARVTVLAGAAAVTVTREELFIGTRIRPCTSTTRNPNPVPGEACFETDTGRLRLWTGAVWATVFDDSGDVEINTLTTPVWSVGVTPVIERRNGIVCLRLGSFRREQSSLAGANESRLPVMIPAAFRHRSRDQYALAYVEGISIGRMTIYSAASERPGQVWLVQKPTISVGGYVLAQSGPSWVVD